MTDRGSEKSAELALLQSIDGKVDKVTAQLDAVGRRAAVTGGLSGSIAGGVVAIAVHYIKMRMGW